jgi:hypothetical protein
LDTHPKTIWRVVYNNKLYLNRYQIIEKKNKVGVLFFMLYLYENSCKYFYYILKVIKSNQVFSYRVFLFILLGIFICIFIIFIVIIYKDIYDQYIFALREGKVNFNKCVLEHRLHINRILNNTNTDTVINITNYIGKEWRYEYIFKNKWTSIPNTNSELGIYQSIVNEINLDFNAKGTGTFSSINSSYSSPIFERVNINNIFSNAIASTNTSNDFSNCLGIQGITYSNINSLIVDNILMNKVKITELLNYQSNILYCLINGLSPNIY